MAVQSATYDGLKEMLQSAVQSVQWTYIIFWQYCPQRGVLVWGDGCYNGAMKTRKTVQPLDFTMEEAALSRSEQLRELYELLDSGEQQVTVRRPAMGLSPEDLTDTEWFYLMSGSFSFPPCVGLVGDAYAKQQHSWLTGAHKANSKVFTRAILAKSASIQTVICIPLLNGVIELGTTDKVKENNEFIQYVKHFFMFANDNPILPPPKPALSSLPSNTIISSHQMPNSMDEDVEDDDDDDEDDEGDDDDGVQNVEDEEDEKGSDFVKETCYISSFQETSKKKTPMIQTSELLQLDMPPAIMFKSSHDSSNNLDSCFNLLATSQDDSCRAMSTPGWSDNPKFHNIHLQTSGLAQEDTRYSQTVSTILHDQFTRRLGSHTTSHYNLVYSIQSSFTTWTSKYHQSHRHPATSQRLLKYMLFTVPFLHSNIKTFDDNTSEGIASQLRKTTLHKELSANHVLSERRRREKLNERFVILRTLVPLVTKMDKASILDDTIEYVKQLHKRIKDLEARCCFDNSKVAKKRKVRVVEIGSSDGGTASVEVSIIENDALVEVQCRHKEGLLLDVMKKLRELGVEIMTIQSCVDGGMFSAEMRAKVKVGKGENGKKISITQVKKAIDQIIFS